MMVISFTKKKKKKSLVEATVVKECVVAFHLHESCRHNKSNAKILGTGYKKLLHILTSHVYSPCKNMCTGIFSALLCSKLATHTACKQRARNNLSRHRHHIISS